MGKFEDLSGKRYGKLVVLNLDENQEKGKDKGWICRCDCGKIKTVTSYHLKSGHTTSCGCNRAIDIQGKKFGRLTVIKRSEKEILLEMYIGCANVIVETKRKYREDF